MNVLVTAASKHGATTEIARAIADALTDAGLEVVVRPPAEVETVAPFDAVILGSAVYAGRWLDDAKDLVARDAVALAARPVWLFSSGPIGQPPKPDGEPVDAAAVREATGALEHRVFAGRVERAGLNLGEKMILKVVKAPEGDFRPWDDVAQWARELATRLDASPAVAGRSRGG